MARSRLGTVLTVLLLAFASSVSAGRSGPARSVALATNALPVIDAPPVPVAAHPSLRSGPGLEWVRVHPPGQSGDGIGSHPGVGGSGIDPPEREEVGPSPVMPEERARLTL